MATTEQRAGFRFPWDGPAQRRSPAPELDGTDDRLDDGDVTTRSASDPDAVDSRAPMITDTDASPTADDAAIGSSTAGAESDAAVGPIDASATVAASPSGGAVDPSADGSAAGSTPSSAGGRSSRLMADLVRAMRTAAEESRGASLEQLRADAKAKIERIHTGSGEDVLALRRESDEEIASIREWSKAEIARIRSETDGRIDRCKQALEADLEDHAATIEREIEEVQARVQRFEAEMSAFFEQLGSIDDPAAFAAAAASLPDAPDLDVPVGQPAIDAPAARREERTTFTGAPPAEDGRPAALRATDALTAAEAEAAAESEAAAHVDDVIAVEADPDTTAPAGVDTEAAEAEALVDTEPPEAVATATDPDAEIIGEEPRADGQEPDPSTDGAGQIDDLESLGEDALAARLGIAGMTVEAAPQPDLPAEAPLATASTRVVVVGLVSVSSIASFKRHLAGIEGVRTVGVSSGPDGEFVFKVEHDPVLALQDALPKIAGFALRVVSSAEGTVQVAANDPDLHS